MSDQMNNFYLSGKVLEIRKITEQMKELVIEFEQFGKLPKAGRAKIITYQDLASLKEMEEVAIWGKFTWNTFQKRDGTEGSSIQLNATKVIASHKSIEKIEEFKDKFVKKDKTEDEIPF